MSTSERQKLTRTFAMYRGKSGIHRIDRSATSKRLQLSDDVDCRGYATQKNSKKFWGLIQVMVTAVADALI
jgi:flagellar basal body L-ring protein FlgH